MLHVVLFNAHCDHFHRWQWIVSLVFRWGILINVSHAYHGKFPAIMGPMQRREHTLNRILVAEHTQWNQFSVIYMALGEPSRIWLCGCIHFEGFSSAKPSHCRRISLQTNACCMLHLRLPFFFLSLLIMRSANKARTYLGILSSVVYWI